MISDAGLVRVPADDVLGPEAEVGSVQRCDAAFP